MPRKGFKNSGIDHNKKIREFTESPTINEFTQRQIIDATGVTKEAANSFLRDYFRRGHLTRRNKISYGKLCFHYSISEEGLPKKCAGKGEISDLVWKILSEEYPRYLTTSEMSHNVLLRVTNCNPYSISAVVSTWTHEGYVKKIGNFPNNRYRLKKLLDQRPIVSH